jgi:hypothetical protein
MVASEQMARSGPVAAVVRAAGDVSRDEAGAEEHYGGVGALEIGWRVRSGGGGLKIREGMCILHLAIQRNMTDCSMDNLKLCQLPLIIYYTTVFQTWGCSNLVGSSERAHQLQVRRYLGMERSVGRGSHCCGT